jgi:hypothetical protein
MHLHIQSRFGSYERIDETTPAQATRRKVSRTVLPNTVSVPAAARSELRLTVEFSGVVQGVSRHISGRHFTIRRSGSGKQQTQYRQRKQLDLGRAKQLDLGRPRQDTYCRRVIGFGGHHDIAS